MAGAAAGEEQGLQESPLDKLVPGTYSAVGRQTKPKPHILRGAFPERAPALKRRSSSALGKLGSTASGLGSPLGGLPSPTAASDSVADAQGEAAVSPAEGNAEDLGATTGSPKFAMTGTTAFTSKGQDYDTFCEKARYINKRFAAPARLEQRPEVGQYKALHSQVLDRNPSWEFGLRPKHPSRKRPSELGQEAELNVTMSPLQWGRTQSPTSSCSPVATKRAWDTISLKGGTLKPDDLKPHHEQMALHSARQPLFKLCHVQNNDGIGLEATEDLHRVFDRTTYTQRQAVYDFAKWSKRKGAVLKECKYFEPGKYAIKYKQVSPDVKDGARFQHHVTDGSLNHNAPKAVLHRDDGTGGMIPDRSVFRAALLARPRITHTSDMAKDTSRPPLIKTGECYYDEDDPEVCAITFEREMSLDASTLDRAVGQRRDYCPNLRQSLTRQRAGNCYRLFQSDPCMRSSKGLGPKETHGDVHGTVEKCKENPNRLKSDTLVSISKVKGRSREGPPTFKPLPFGDFERKAKPGFSVRTSVSTPVLRGARVYEALADWSPEDLAAEE